MTVPRRFVGAWERQRLEIDGEAVHAIARALWIEAGGTYVDVRAPGTVASGTSFGDSSAWRSPVFTWRHGLDLHPRPGSVDRGHLAFHGDLLVERGTGIDGNPAEYEEHWRRLPAATDIRAIAEHEHGLAVRVGDHAGVIVGERAHRPAWARAWTLTDGRWHAMMSLGSPDALPQPRAAGWRLPRGWHAR